MVRKGKGRLIVISAPSGAGKTTLVKKLLQHYPELPLAISWTTRPRRKNEISGTDYHFVTDDEFFQGRQQGHFLEFEKVHGYFYGTPRDQVEQLIDKGKSVILDIDTKGALTVKRTHPNAALIFIQPPSLEVLRNRLEGRDTESQEEIDRRLRNAEQEMRAKEQFDYVIINQEIEPAFGELSNHINEITKSSYGQT